MQPVFRPARLFALMPFALLLCAASSAVRADDSASLTPLSAQQHSATSTAKEVGMGVGVGPSYLGARKRRWGVGGYGEANFGNGVFLSAGDGLGYRFLETPSGFSMTASIGFSMMREERDGRDGNRNRLRGMGDVDLKAQANVFLNYDSGPFHANAVVHQTLAERRGTGVDLSVGYDLLADRDDLVRADVDLSYANRSLMQTFFGVTAQQAARSGNAFYTPRAGIAGAGATVTWRHAFNANWVGTLEGGIIQLRGAAANSPVTERKTTPAAAAAIGYRF